MLKYTQHTNNYQNSQKTPQANPSLLLKLYQMLLERVSDVFEWSQTKKSQLVNALSALTCVCQIIVLDILIQLDLPPEHALHPITHQYGLSYLIGSLILYSTMMLAGNLFYHAPNIAKNIYCFLSLLAHGVGAIIITYFLGPLSIATGVCLMMIPLIGLILFRHQLIIVTAICITPISLTIFGLVVLEKLPYTLLIETTESMHKNISLLAFIYGSGLPFVAGGLFIAYACVERWKQRENMVRTLSTTDALTQLANRSEFLNNIKMYLSRPRMHRKAISLIMMDLDNFKQINDRYGHLMGDAVLENIFNTLANTVRENDLVARYGGEEFCILLPDTRQETAEIIAQRILLAIKETTTYRNGDSVSVTTSIGLTTADTYQLNSPKIDINMLLAAIDKGMYASKNKGKNTLTFIPLPIDVI